MVDILYDNYCVIMDYCVIMHGLLQNLALALSV